MTHPIECERCLDRSVCADCHANGWRMGLDALVKACRECREKRNADKKRRRDAKR